MSVALFELLSSLFTVVKRVLSPPIAEIEFVGRTPAADTYQHSSH